MEAKEGEDAGRVAEGMEQQKREEKTRPMDEGSREIVGKWGPRGRWEAMEKEGALQGSEEEWGRHDEGPL